jgi:23S rRNA (uridine2552-2'-O)-methyltransferase
MKRIQDHYFRKAKREGFAARSAYKLEEMDRKQRLLRPHQRVLDLGCAPGSWLQYAAERVGPKGVVIGADLQPVTVPLPPQAHTIVGDAFALSPETLRDGGPPFDLVLSDMAPKTTGIPSADAARSAELALRALDLARAVLRPGGDLLVKVFQGAQLPDVRKAYAVVFERVTLEKPAASRSESVEIFLLGRSLRPATAAPLEPQPKAATDGSPA